MDFGVTSTSSSSSMNSIARSSESSSGGGSLTFSNDLQTGAQDAGQLGVNHGVGGRAVR
jgi:hypothetical protein